MSNACTNSGRHIDCQYGVDLDLDFMGTRPVESNTHIILSRDRWSWQLRGRRLEIPLISGRRSKSSDRSIWTEPRRRRRWQTRELQARRPCLQHTYRARPGPKCTSCFCLDPRIPSVVLLDRRPNGNLSVWNSQLTHSLTQDGQTLQCSSEDLHKVCTPECL